MVMLSRSSDVLLTRAYKQLRRADMPASSVMCIHAPLLSESRADYKMKIACGGLAAY
jgi:hypothetical protein